jgi:hypothetical protein
LNPSDPSEVLRTILADPEFESDWQEHLGRWLGQGWRAFQRWLTDLPDLERWALLLCCIGILTWLVWTMIASYREMMAPDTTATGGETESTAEPTWQMLMARARTLASEGRLREGARALQQAVYSALASRQRLAWDGARADWEWVARLRNEPGSEPELATFLIAFTENAQAIAYGADSGAAQFESLLAIANRWMRS